MFDAMFDFMCFLGLVVLVFGWESWFLYVGLVGNLESIVLVFFCGWFFALAVGWFVALKKIKQ